MGVWEQLEPKPVFQYFEEICGMPHGSGNTAIISDYLVAFAKTQGLKYRQDTAGNVIIWKSATPGYEESPTVILQGHMDMVAVKTADCMLNLDKDALLPAITDDGEWVYAKGTSLGGDDGIAVAYAMAILASDDIPHPALEAVFTVDEEVGMLGADAITTEDLKGRIMLNMDSEEDGIFMVGCAGGAMVDCRLPVHRTEKHGSLIRIAIRGLTGGHSGEEIHKERGNANVIMGRLLWKLKNEMPFDLCFAGGGEKDNVIAPASEAVILVDEDQANAILECAARIADHICDEYSYTDPDMEVEVQNIGDDTQQVIIGTDLDRLLMAWIQYPNGVQRRMPNLLDMVQTSLNLGILCTREDEVSMTFLIRSAVNQEKEWLMERVISLTDFFGGHCNVSGVYPGWEYKENSRIRDLLVEEYVKLTGEQPELKAFHAGVECGIFCEKIPGLDVISYGPEMHDIHSVKERLNIASVKRNFELTCNVLRAIR